YVFHGMEHSRFSHSMGVAHISLQMYDKIVRNGDLKTGATERMATCVAGLLHDVGHGPFSHTIEDVFKELSLGIAFDHEDMSKRIITEPESNIHKCLTE